MAEYKQEIDKKKENAHEIVEEYLMSHFPRFRQRAGGIVTAVYIGLILLSTILGGFGIGKDLDMLADQKAVEFLIKLLFLKLVLPLAVMNVFIRIFLKPVHIQFFQYFKEKQIRDVAAYKAAIERMQKINNLTGYMIIGFFLITNPWGLQIRSAGSLAGVGFYILSQISMSLVMFILNDICLRLFVRRRLLYVMDLYELDSGISFLQKKAVQNTFIPAILILNVMFIFTDLSLRISFLELKEGTGAALQAGALAKGYGILILMLLIQSALIFLFQAILQTRQVKDLSRKVEDLASGSSDLTKKIRILEIDENGLLISNLNKFIGNLREKLLTVESVTLQVMDSSETLFTELQNTSAATEEMVASVEQINRTTTSRAEVVDQTSRNLLSMIESLEQVKKSVDTQATFVEQTSSAINEMAASINSVSEATGKANTLSVHLSEAASAGGTAVNNSITAVKNVENSSEEVNHLVTAITKIAGQTNMLAMNAAIEAAHAGDAGRGFAVVAEEVRNLAENSSMSAKMITEQIQSMVELVNTGVHMSENAGSALNNVLSDISQATELINGIALAMEEQNAGAREILNSISSLVEATQVIKKISQDEMDKNQEMRVSIDQVVQAFEEIRQATEEQTRGTRDMIGIVSQLQYVAKDNQGIVKTLKEAFSGFKLH